MDRGTPSVPVLHYRLEFPQIPVHWIGAAIQPSHPLLPPSPFASIFPSIRVLSNESAVRVCVCVCVCDIVIYKQWWCYFFLCNLDSYYFCLCFFSFFCLIAVTSTSSGLPWWLRWVMRVGILVLLPVLGEIFSAFHHWWCLLWVCLFIMLRYVPSPHSLLIIFVINRCWILSEAFPASIIWSYDFYSLIC